MANPDVYLTRRVSWYSVQAPVWGRWYSGQAPVSHLSDPGSIPTLTNVEKSFHLNDPRVMLNVGHLYRFRIVNSRWYRCTVVVYMSVI